MDAERDGTMLAQLQHPFGDDLGELAAVGVAQHHGVRAGLLGGVERRQGVARVLPPPVEVVLGVVHDFAAQALEPGHALADHAQVFLPRGLQHPVHVKDGGLADEGDHRRAGLHQGADVAVLLAAGAGAAGAAERRDLRLGRRGRLHPAEELGVLGIGAGPAALDVVHAEPVERQGDLHLVVHREGESLALGAVPQCGIVEPDRRGAGYGHGVPGKRKRPLEGEAACRYRIGWSVTRTSARRLSGRVGAE